MSMEAVLVRAELTLCRDIPREVIPSLSAASSMPRPPVGGTAIVRLTTMTQRSGHRPGMVTGEAAPASDTAETSATTKATDEHLLADLDAADAASLGIADVIVQRGGSDLTGHTARLARIFARHPGCAVAACPLGERHLVGLRDGSSIVLALNAVDCPDAGMGGLSATAMCASLVHAWVANGRSLDALGSVAVVAAPGRWPGGGRVTYRVDRVRPAGAASRRQARRGVP
jgi:hypothetical protein